MSVFSRSKEDIEMEEKFGKMIGEFIAFDFDKYIKNIEIAENSKDLPEFLKPLIADMKKIAIKFKATKNDCEEDIKNVVVKTFETMSENMDEMFKIMKNQ